VRVLVCSLLTVTTPSCDEQGASWSSMDFGGNWRLLHYTMKKMYAPCLISAHRNRTSGQIEVWLVSDINEPVTGE